VSRDDLPVAPARAIETFTEDPMAKATWKGERVGWPKSREHREKLRAAALARYAKQGERERTQEIVKEAFKTIDRSGANNGHFGKPHSDDSKKMISDKVEERGGHRGARNPNYRHGRYVED